MINPVSNDLHDVVIIGAGLSGLSAAYALRQQGIDPLIIEKEGRIAEPWRKRHPQLHLNTHRKLSSLPGYALESDGPPFPSRDEVISYLERYSKATEANICYKTAVKGVQSIGGHWRLGTTTGMVHARNVIFATGKEHTPSIPDWPGKEKWRGRLIHSAELGDVGQFAGKDILVVGAGNSGTDVLNHLARVPARSVRVSVRHGSTIVPTWFLGFPVQLGSPVMDKLPLGLLDKILAATEWLAFGDLRRFGLPRRKGGASRLIHEGVSPAIDRGFVAALKRGDARIVGQMSHLTEDAVVLADGERLRPDVVIAATGYETGLAPLLENLGVLNERGMPICEANGEAVEAPGLWFAGMSPRLTGYFWAARHNSWPMAKAIAARLAQTEELQPATSGVLQTAE
jgi:Pyridine nucleotide-disulphide oxidoreductase